MERLVLHLLLCVILILGRKDGHANFKTWLTKSRIHAYECRPLINVPSWFIGLLR